MSRGFVASGWSPAAGGTAGTASGVEDESVVDEANRVSSETVWPPEAAWTIGDGGRADVPVDATAAAADRSLRAAAKGVSAGKRHCSAQDKGQTYCSILLHKLARSVSSKIQIPVA